jgi:hypothetical protein
MTRQRSDTVKGAQEIISGAIGAMVGNGEIRLVKQGKKERYVSQS